MMTKAPLTNEVIQLAAHLKDDLEIDADNYHPKGVGENDLLIIATAKLAGVTLVSEEGRQLRLPDKKAKYKIPTVCKLPGADVECITFIELIRLSGAIFH
jgi:hypothetical protein